MHVPMQCNVLKIFRGDHRPKADVEGTYKITIHKANTALAFLGLSLSKFVQCGLLILLKILIKLK